jgi:hypothetical protein
MSGGVEDIRQLRLSSVNVCYVYRKGVSGVFFLWSEEGARIV